MNDQELIAEARGMHVGGTTRSLAHRLADALEAVDQREAALEAVIADVRYIARHEEAELATLDRIWKILTLDVVVADAKAAAVEEFNSHWLARHDATVVADAKAEERERIKEITQDFFEPTDWEWSLWLRKIEEGTR